MATKIQGKDVIFRVFDGGWKPVACNVSCELTSTADILERLPLNDGYWKEHVYDSLSWGVRCDNITIVDDILTKGGIPLMMETQHNFLELLCQFTVSGAANDYVLSGRVIIPSIVLSGAVDDFSRNQIEFVGTGPLTISNDTPVPMITIQTTGFGTGSIDTIILRHPITLEEYSLVGAIPNGSSETMLLDGVGAHFGPGEYYVEAIVSSEEDVNHFIVDAPPTANELVGAGASTILDTAPFGNTVLYDFNTNRTITFNIEGVNDPPVADAGIDQTIELPTSSVVLDGSGSTDDGTIVSYLWEFVSGGSYTIVTGAFPVTLVTGLEEGVYVFRLTVTDDGGLTDTDEVTITVDPDPSPGPAVTIEVTGVGTGTTGYVQLVDPSTLAYWTSPTFNMTPGTTLTWPLNGVGSNPPPGTYWIAGYVDSSVSPNHMITDAPPTANEVFPSGGQSLLSLTHPTAFDFTTSRTITFTLGS